MPSNFNALGPITSEQSWVQGGPYRLITKGFVSGKISKNPILLIALHGDAPFNKPDNHYAFAVKVAAMHRNVVAIGLLRPGYTDPQGNRSDGERGLSTGDNWQAINTDAVADAISNLKRNWNACKVVIAAHSGGAAIAANILGRNLELINRALLVSGPYDVEKWRQHMFKLTDQPVFMDKIEVLSPVEQIIGMSDQVEVILMVGCRDEVTPPCFSEQYEVIAQQHRKNVRLIRLEGLGHEIFLDPTIFAELRPMLK